MVHGKDTEMMVSVIMITYGHEKYIEEAINGVFIQQTDFPVELIIANDCSPDQTDEVVKSLLRRAPENITVRYTKHQTNKGMNANFLWAASQATGKYIALCEGDDYWTDPLKLQKQVDFLEENEEYGVVCTKYQILENNDIKSVNFLPDCETDITTERLVYSNPIGTLTTVIEGDLLNEVVKRQEIKMDINLWLHLSKFKKIKYIPEETVIYRVLQNSASSRNDLQKQAQFLKPAIINDNGIHSGLINMSILHLLMYKSVSEVKELLGLYQLI